MPSTDVLEIVRQIMIDIFDVDDLQVTEATSAKDIEEWDSLTQVRLMVAVERRFGFSFSNSEIESLMNLGDLVKAIKAKTA